MGIPNGLNGLNTEYGVPYTENTQLNPTWRNENIVMMELPYPMRLAWDLDGKVTKIAIHRKCVDDLTKILTEIWDAARKMAKADPIWAKKAPSSLPSSPAGGFDEVKAQARERAITAYWNDLTWEIIRRYGLDVYGGAFNFRKKRGTRWWGARALSTHSWGCAIDIDPENNGMGDASYSMPEWVIRIFERYGWFAGARWKGGGVDAMHFQRATGV